MMKCFNTYALITLSSLLLLQSASAIASVVEPLDISLSYQVSTNINQPITQIVTFNRYQQNTGTGPWWPATIGANGGTIDDPFLKSSANAPTEALMLGLVSDLPNDAPGQKHVVMMLDSTAASQNQNIAWGTTFRNTLEEQIIADLELAIGTTKPDADPIGAAAWDAALNGLLTFVDGDANNMFFSLGIPVLGTTTTRNFSVQAWSDGTTIGTGTSNLTYNPSAVPVPAAIWFFGSGLLGLLNMRKKFNLVSHLSDR